jgi:tetratricopeptide (TPR) repeat protein
MMDFYKTTSLLGFNYDKEFADYLLSFNREELRSHKNWISFYYNIYQKHFVIYAKYLLEEKKLIEIIGKEKFETVKDSAFKNLYKILKYDPENFKQTEEEAKMFLLNEADIMESFNFFTSYNWLATIEEKARGKYRNDEWILQSYAFTIINETRNSDTLKIAMDLIKQSINIKENAENLDTYAILLYTEGKKDEAIKTEERAVSISDRDDSKKIYKKTIKLFINNEPIEKILGRYDN